MTTPSTIHAEEKREESLSPGTSALEAYKAEHGGKKPPTTRGEKLFNLLDYYGIGFGVNTAISMYLSDKFKHAEWRPLYNKMVDKMGKNTTEFFTLGTGGFILLIPIKLMEDHKEWWARKLDGIFGDKHPSQQAAQAIEARYEEIRQEPKQTYLSEFVSRILAFVMNLGVIKAVVDKKNVLSSVGIPFEGLEEESAKLTVKNMEFLHDAEAHPYIAEKTAKLEAYLEKGPKVAAEKLAKAGKGDEFTPMTGKERLQSLLMLGYFDAACAAGSSTLQFIWTRILAPVLGKKEPCEPLPASLPQSSYAPPAFSAPSTEQAQPRPFLDNQPGTKVEQAIAAGALEAESPGHHAGIGS